MPLDAQDKALHEEITAVFQRSAGSSRKLVEAGSDLTKILLEVIPPNAPFRKEILKHVKRIALLTHVALNEAEPAKASAASG
jgi:hypothetical protein